MDGLSEGREVNAVKIDDDGRLEKNDEVGLVPEEVEDGSDIATKRTLAKSVLLGPSTEKYGEWGAIRMLRYSDL